MAQFIKIYLFKADTKIGIPNSACSVAFIKHVFPKLVSPPFAFLCGCSFFSSFVLSRDFFRFGDFGGGEGETARDGSFSLSSSFLCLI